MTGFVNLTKETFAAHRANDGAGSIPMLNPGAPPANGRPIRTSGRRPGRSERTAAKSSGAAGPGSCRSARKRRLGIPC